MGEVIPSYEIRLFRADGRLSLVMITAAISDADAKAQASKLLTGDLTSAQIWRDLDPLESISLLPGERANEAA